MTEKFERIFIVGCGRSGTTLLQAMLSAHHDVISFPESQFFSNVVDQYEERVMGSPEARVKLLYLCQSLLLNAGIAPRPVSGIKAINRFIDKTAITLEQIRFNLGYLLLENQIAKMTDIMDSMMIDQNKNVWLMKTPSNVSYIDVIQKYIDGAKFIHILRPGKDVVASIYDAAHKYPDTVWYTHFYKGSIRRLTEMWNQAIRQTIRYAEKSNHLIVSYEALVKEPVKEMSRVFDFIGIENDPTCCTRYSSQTSNIVSDNEKWKSGVDGEVKKVDKYAKLFDPRQKNMIKDLLLDVDIESIVDTNSKTWCQ